jgi:hypothetical protein
MIEHVSWIKSLGGVLKAVFDRLAVAIGRRKAKLFVHFQPGTSIWCIATSGPGLPSIEYMQIVCRASFAHDDLKEPLVIIDAYPAGTAPEVKAMEPFTIQSQELVQEQIVAIVAPVIGEKGHSWTGRIVFVDQYLRKHKTQKSTFKWVGPAAQTTK